MELLPLLPTLLIAIVGYFLRETMTDIKQLKHVANDMEIKLRVIENDYLNKHTNLTIRFEELNQGVKELTKEIKELNKELTKNNHRHE